MISTERALLAAIRAQQSEDSPRLVYADWLDEQGDADRAEFIRVQCALAILDLPRKAMSQLRHREQVLLSANGHYGRFQWGSMGAPWPDWNWSFRRGFIASISCLCAAWIEHAGAAWMACPGLEEVRLTDKEPSEHSHARILRWSWHLETIIEESRYRLPAPLWLHLKPKQTSWYAEFDSRAAALHALSQAALAYGQEEAAGLTDGQGIAQNLGHVSG